MSEPTVADVAQRTSGVVAWARALGSGAFVLVAGAIAWSTHSNRVSAAEVRLDAQERKDAEHDAAIRALRESDIAGRWNAYVTCVRIEQLTGPGLQCEPPPERP